MNPIIGILTAILATTVTASIVALILHRPLGRILCELCGNEDRARFWQVFALLFVVLTALSVTLLAVPDRGREALTWSTATVVSAVRAGIIGAGMADSFDTVTRRPDMVELVYSQLVPGGHG